jgi:hypothetical protein
MIDPPKMTPAPWKSIFHGFIDPSKPWRVADADGDTVSLFVSETDANQCALARNAFDVMMRRGWEFRTVPGLGFCATSTTGHCVDEIWRIDGNNPMPKRFWPDPFTALVEADKWYRHNIEKVGA